MAKITFEDKNKFAGQPLNQLTDANVTEIKTSVNALYGADDNPLGYVDVTELPATIPPGVQLLYNGTMWRGLLEGESSLAAGTPWPVKGFKEWTAKVTQVDSSTLTANIIKSDIPEPVITSDDPWEFKIGIPETTGMLFSETRAGYYDALDAGILFRTMQEETHVFFAILDFTVNPIEQELTDIPISFRFYPPAP
jgi:hypothetical protein